MYSCPSRVRNQRNGLLSYKVISSLYSGCRKREFASTLPFAQADSHAITVAEHKAGFTSYLNSLPISDLLITYSSVRASLLKPGT